MRNALNLIKIVSSCGFNICGAEPVSYIRR
jgi:hypothetical protein